MGLPAYKTNVPTYVSPEDYLRLEQAASSKHEYFAGEIRAMAGASYVHNRISANLMIELGRQLLGKSCTPVGSDQRVHVKNEASFLYPDVSVVCGEPKFLEHKRPDTLLNPTLLVEVLSASTAGADRGEKFMLYRQIPSLRQYLLLDSQTVHVELYSLDELGRWVLTETRDRAAVLDLGSVGAVVALERLYQGVPLEG